MYTQQGIQDCVSSISNDGVDCRRKHARTSLLRSATPIPSVLRVDKNPHWHSIDHNLQIACHELAVRECKLDGGTRWWSVKKQLPSQFWLLYGRFASGPSDLDITAANLAAGPQPAEDIFDVARR